MKTAFTHFLLLCGLWPLSSIAQIGVADPITGNASINFYGRVVDQDGKPLAGAKVDLRILVGYLVSPIQLGTRYDKTTLGTDTNGNFIITGAKGHSVEIESIEKDGYKLSEKADRLYPYSWSAGIFHPNSKKPVTFKMWKMRGAEPLVGSAWHGNVPCDGTLLTFDLLRGKRVKDGNLHIICTRVPLNILPREGKRYDYNLQIAVPGGGIQTTEDEFTYLAPENGYFSSLNIGQKADATNWVGKVKQEFYIKTAEGHYGRLSVDWYTPQTTPTHFEWNCSINPSGSRNLER